MQQRGPRHPGSVQPSSASNSCRLCVSHPVQCDTPPDFCNEYDADCKCTECQDGYKKKEGACFPVSIAPMAMPGLHQRPASRASIAQTSIARPPRPRSAPTSLPGPVWTTKPMYATAKSASQATTCRESSA